MKWIIFIYLHSESWIMIATNEALTIIMIAIVDALYKGQHKMLQLMT